MLHQLSRASRGPTACVIPCLGFPPPPSVYQTRCSGLLALGSDISLASQSAGSDASEMNLDKKKRGKGEQVGADSGELLSLL